MNLKLIREYDPEKTDGVIYDDQGNKICYSLELPDLQNQHKISCIPEGIYHFHKFLSPHLGSVFRLENVPNRDLIDIHTGNTVLDIEGCILVGTRRGVQPIKGKIYPAVLDSHTALDRLFATVGNAGTITITSEI